MSAYDKLKARHRTFVDEWLIDHNGKRAAITAGYAASGAKVRAVELLAREDVKAALAEKQAKRAKACDITAERVLRELATIAFADPRAVMAWGPGGVALRESADLTDAEAALLAEISETKEGMRVKLHSKLDALGKIGQHLGMFKDRVEHTGKDGGPIKIDDISLARWIAFELTKADKET